MSVTSLDFESSAYTNFATPAYGSGHDNCPSFSRQPTINVSQSLLLIHIYHITKWGDHLSSAIMADDFILSIVVGAD
jgi:hypothetical protein